MRLPLLRREFANRLVRRLLGDRCELRVFHGATEESTARLDKHSGLYDREEITDGDELIRRTRQAR